MRIIFTGPKGNLGYWDASAPRVGCHAFGLQGRFKRQNACSFARLSAFARNSNHAPTGHDGAITSDLSLGLLQSIAGTG